MVGYVQVVNRVSDVLDPKVMGEEGKEPNKAEKKDYPVLYKIDILGCDTWSTEEQVVTQTLL